MFDFGIEAVREYEAAAYYGRIWLIEFWDYATTIVLENTEPDSDDLYDAGNFVMSEVGYETLD